MKFFPKKESIEKFVYKFSHFIRNANRGFTFIEIVVVMALLSTLTGLITMNLLKVHQTENIQNTSKILVSDLKSQQTKAMSESTQNTSSPDSFGIYFNPSSYTLFKGTTYNAGDPSNAQINLPDGFNFSNVTLPSSQVIFSKGSGEVINFIDGQNTFTLRDSQGTTSTLQVNKYGAIY